MKLQFFLYVIIISLVVNLLANMVWKYLPGTDSRIDIIVTAVLVGICIILLIFYQGDTPEKPPERNTAGHDAPVKQPDISVRIVGPKAIAIVVINESRALIRDARYTLVVWNLDSDQVDSLPVVDRTAEWIRPEEHVLPEAFASSPQIAPLIKQGDRLLGIADVSCPDCIRTKSYWVYAIHGQGGWFAESPVGKYPNPSMVARLINLLYVST